MEHSRKRSIRYLLLIYEIRAPTTRSTFYNQNRFSNTIQYIPPKYTHPKDHPEEIARREEMKNKRNDINIDRRKRKRN